MREIGFRLRSITRKKYRLLSKSQRSERTSRRRGGKCKNYRARCSRQSKMKGKQLKWPRLRSSRTGLGSMRKSKKYRKINKMHSLGSKMP